MVSLDAIIFDLELIKRFKKGQLSQIVEIGACKIDLDTKQIVDEIQIYILPKGGYISKNTRKFINMKKEDIKKAVSFAEGIETFSKWIGDNYFLCSWGRDDKVHIINQCVRNKIKIKWFKNYNDIQKKIGNVIKTDNKKQQQLGLKNALDLANIEAVGVAHRGLDDAINTAQLFMKYIDDIVLEENSISDKEIKQYYLQYIRSRQRDQQHNSQHDKKSDNHL